MGNRYKDVLLTSEDTIKSYTNLNDNTSGEYISPAIYMAQHSDLERIIGTKLTRKLQMLVSENSIDYVENDYYRELLDDYVTDFLAYATIVRLIPIVSFKLGNSGIVRTDEEKVINMSYNEVFNIKDYYQNQADYLAYRLQKYLLANYSKFPELSTYKTMDEIRATLTSSASCGIFLGGERGK